ncbi:sensor histidine kinase [Truepera radiovictrix]|uniref:sensor histidine kinase n=1 Tax=Truepera radiovictrix TaxID=332249 RepID=UPI00031E6595|nr:HAMP domain-containing sensor histidine kinase [Truepera radiovictrix]WMT56268.1 HAMP domain-containing sensor histidine kinase [Truepera radiovictrix]
MRRARRGFGVPRRLSLQARLTLLLLSALLLVLVPLGAFTLQEARRASLATLSDALLVRLGFYSAVTPGDLVPLAALANEFGGYGFVYHTEEGADAGAGSGALRFTDTAAHTLPESVRRALEAGATYTGLHGDALFAVVPLEGGAVGLSVQAGAIGTLTQRLLSAYALAALGLFALVGLLGAQLLRLVLAPLNRMAAAIARRSPDNLAPLAVPDLPEVRPIAERLNQLLRELSRALERSAAQERSARRFAAQASHELRTPLAALSGYLEVLQRRPDEPRALAGALREMARMRGLLDALLTLARLEGRARISAPPLELRAFVRERFPHLALAGAAEPVYTRADPELLEVALRNLLRNAERYGAPPVTLSVLSREGRAQLVVEDAGPGFPEALLARVLEPFVYGAAGEGAAGGEGARGTGLGLAIVRAVMAVHGGDVVAENAPHGGARVTLRFSFPSGWGGERFSQGG